jgi:hypothetical protein
MPKLSDPETQPPVRMMLIGDSGTGKTGSLASLAKAGYNLYIADFDNGMEILRNLLRDDPAALARVDFETCRDTFEVQGNNTVPKEARAWAKGIKYLESALKHGLGPNEILVVDSLSFAAYAAMLYILKLNNRLTKRPWQSDWGEAQNLTENLVGMLTADIDCHVICTAHIATSGGQHVERVEGREPIVIDEGPIRRLPSMIGKAFNPKVPRYFNHMLLTHRVGSGAAAKYSIKTRTFDDIELKNTNPGIIKAEYPLATGLADYFADARGLPKGTSK